MAYKGLNHFSVQVRYPGPSGHPRTAEIYRATTKYEVGQTIDVYYQPETGYKVVAGDFMQMWFHTVVVGTMALVLLFFGLKPDRNAKTI
jgi:hypothetical protein